MTDNYSPESLPGNPLPPHDADLSVTAPYPELSAPAFASAPAPTPTPVYPPSALPQPPQPGYTTPGYATPGYPAPAYAAPVYVVQKPTNGLAVTAGVAGIVGLLFGWATFLVFVPILVSIAAIIMGHIALGQIKKNPATSGRGMALTGVVLGYISVGGTVLLFVLGILAALFFGAALLPFVVS